MISRADDISRLAERILNDIPEIIPKICTGARVQSDEVKELLIEVVRFLYLIHDTKQRLTPSKIVDDAWHEFILFTRYYMGFCDEQFGQYIHHHPGGPESENAS